MDGKKIKHTKEKKKSAKLMQILRILKNVMMRKDVKKNGKEIHPFMP